jgi:hypothetical protein
MAVNVGLKMDDTFWITNSRRTAMPTREQLRQKFQEKAGAAFDAMFDSDQQEQLITLVQREDRVLQKGAELQAWLLEEHLKADPLADPAASEALRCPKCHSLGVRVTDEQEPVPRRLTSRAGPQEIQRWKYRCPSCRTVFFPLGR